MTNKTDYNGRILSHRGSGGEEIEWRWQKSQAGVVTVECWCSKRRSWKKMIVDMVPKDVSLVKPAEIETQETELHVVVGRFPTPPPQSPLPSTLPLLFISDTK